MEQRKVTPEYFYKVNTKSGTAGYDKWVYVGVIGGRAMYKNKRTSASKTFPVEERNGELFIPDKLFYPEINTYTKVLFRCVPDFYKYSREGDFWWTSEQQFLLEEKQIRENYPEYFI